MGWLRRGLGYYIAPPAFIKAPFAPWLVGSGGHVPFDVIVDRISGQGFNYDNVADTPQLYVGGAPVGPQLHLASSGAPNVQTFDEPVTILKPTTSGAIDTQAFGFHSLYPAAQLALRYWPINDVDRGKQILGIGDYGTPMLCADSVGQFAGIQNNFENDGFGGWSGYNTSNTFNTNFELDERYAAGGSGWPPGSTPGLPRFDGDVAAVAAVPMAATGQFGGFYIIARGGAAGGTFVVAFRVNGVTVREITLTSGQYFSTIDDAAAVTVMRGQRVNFKLLSGSGANTSAELVFWWKRLTESDPGWMADGAFDGGYSG